jgi:hypothetical protein
MVRMYQPGFNALSLGNKQKQGSTGSSKRNSRDLPCQITRLP